MVCQALPTYVTSRVFFSMVLPPTLPDLCLKWAMPLASYNGWLGARCKMMKISCTPRLINQIESTENCWNKQLISWVCRKNLQHQPNCSSVNLMSTWFTTAWLVHDHINWGRETRETPESRENWPPHTFCQCMKRWYPEGQWPQPAANRPPWQGSPEDISSHLKQNWLVVQ